MTQSGELDALNARFGIEGALRFEAGAGGLTRAVAEGDAGTGALYLHGAHVTAYAPAGHEPVIFVGRSAKYSPGSSIRGGVPICFPWFGAKAGDPSAPSHGLARTRSWMVVGSGRTAEGGVTLTLGLDFGELAARYVVVVGTTLGLTLEVDNRTDRTLTFEEALHSYLAVSDARTVEVTGLEGATYLDQLAGRARRTEGEEPIRLVGETDRIYLGTSPRKVVHDPGLGRRVVVDARDARTTVLWNPWTEKTARMGDLEDDEWPRMLCIETGNIADDAVTLEAEGRHAMGTTISVEG